MIAFWQRLFRDHRRLVDAVMVLVSFGAAIPGSRLGGVAVPAPHTWWPCVAVVAPASAALPWRRERPQAVALVAAASAVAVSALGFLPSILVQAPAVFALFALANSTSRRITNTIAFASVVAVIVASVATRPAESIDVTMVAPAACLLLPVAIGTTTRIRRAYVESLRARAEYAELTREEEARHRVGEERVRIARELHDVVAHHIALANAQAGAVAHIMRSRPEQAEKMLGDLTRTTSSALRELKATVGLLRQSDDPETPLQPAPGLAQFPELTSSLATAGLAVTLDTEGRPRPLSPGVDLTAYRILQEALTNVAKHAATRAARVRLTYTHDRLTITVANEDDGASPAASAPSSGFGLISMRERANSVGGRLLAGHRPEGGFAVTAELPLDPYDPEETTAS